MINMIKMDLYRLRRTKSMYVIWAIMALVILFTTAMSKMDGEQLAETATQMGAIVVEQEEETETTNIGMAIELPENTGNTITVYDMVYANVQGKAVALFIVIFAVLFATGDLNSGYIKNIGGQVKSRGKIVVSKAFAIFVFTILTMLLFILIQAVSNGIFLGYIEWGNIGDFLLYSVIEILLHFAFAIICMSVAILLRNNVVSMILAVCMCMNVLMLLYNAIDKLIHKIGVEDFQLVNYTVTGKISMMSYEITSKESVSAICVAAVFIVGMLVLSGIVFEKKDI